MKNDFHKLKPFLKPLITLPSPPLFPPSCCCCFYLAANTLLHRFLLEERLLGGPTTEQAHRSAPYRREAVPTASPACRPQEGFRLQLPNERKAPFQFLRAQIIMQLLLFHPKSLY